MTLATPLVSSDDDHLPFPWGDTLYFWNNYLALNQALIGSNSLFFILSKHVLLSGHPFGAELSTHCIWSFAIHSGEISHGNQLDACTTWDDNANFVDDKLLDDLPVFSSGTASCKMDRSQISTHVWTRSREKTCTHVRTRSRERAIGGWINCLLMLLIALNAPYHLPLFEISTRTASTVCLSYIYAYMLDTTEIH